MSARSAEAFDEGSEVRAGGRRCERPRGHFSLRGGRPSCTPPASISPPCSSAFSFLRTSKRRFPTPAAIIFPFRFHARHWLWIRLGLEAAVGQTITRTTDEANLFIRIGYQNIPVNLDEAQRQIGIHTEYSIMSARSA